MAGDIKSVIFIMFFRGGTCFLQLSLSDTLYAGLGLWLWSWDKPDRSVGAIRFNRCTTLAKGRWVGGIHLITKREHGGKAWSPTVCFMRSQGINFPPHCEISWVIYF